MPDDKKQRRPMQPGEVPDWNSDPRAIFLGDINTQPYDAAGYLDARRAALGNMEDENFLQAFVREINSSEPGRKHMRDRANKGDDREKDRMARLAVEQQGIDKMAKYDTYAKSPQATIDTAKDFARSASKVPVELMNEFKARITRRNK